MEQYPSGIFSVIADVVFFFFKKKKKGSDVQWSLSPKFALLFCSCPQCWVSGSGVTTSTSSCSSSWRTTRSWRSLARIGSTCSTGTPSSREPSMRVTLWALMGVGDDPLFSHVSVVPCVFVLCVLPTLPDSDKKVSLFFFSRWAQKSVDTRWFSSQCCECQSDVNSNKSGCGSPAQAQAQASARVYVPTALVFPASDPGVQHVCKFCVNAWIRTPQATDRDPESFNVNAWMCAQATTDRDLETKSERLDMRTAVNRPWFYTR